jgi:hypothetical protein
MELSIKPKPYLILDSVQTYNFLDETEKTLFPLDKSWNFVEGSKMRPALKCVGKISIEFENPSTRDNVLDFLKSKMKIPLTANPTSFNPLYAKRTCNRHLAANDMLFNAYEIRMLKDMGYAYGACWQAL